MWWKGDLFRHEAPEGQAFVFAPLNGGLSTCSTFRMEGEMADEVMAFRPAGPSAPQAASPVEEAESEARTKAMVASIAGGAALLGGGILVMRKRRARL
jgi:hypothetical protein